MRVMVIVKATKESEAESHPLDMEGAEEMFEQMGRFNEELIEAGIVLAGDGLKPSKFGKRIHFNGTKRSVLATWDAARLTGAPAPIGCHRRALQCRCQVNDPAPNGSTPPP